jgi:hypothetical protein
MVITNWEELINIPYPRIKQLMVPENKKPTNTVRINCGLGFSILNSQQGISLRGKPFS